MSITCKAAVAWKPNEKLSIEEIEVLPPCDKEVRIQLLSSALCRTDYSTLLGKNLEAVFPCILGHEGFGIVESIGSKVKEFKKGDYVIPLFIPQCRNCKACKRSDTNLCRVIRKTQAKGLMPDGTTRFRCKGQQIYHCMGCSTFSEFTVVSEISLCKVDLTAQMKRSCLLGCGVPTGYGAVVKVAKVTRDSKCAVFGLGPVGLAVVMGCKLAGAKEIAAIDVNSDKFEHAKKFGATVCINPNDIDVPIQTQLTEDFDGGFDFTFECTGNVNVMRAALESCHEGFGKSVILGVAAAGEEISTRPFMLVCGRSWTGCMFGGLKGKDEVPELALQFKKGDFDLDSFVTHDMKLEQINDAFDVLRSGKCLKIVLDFE